ncbi:hypothetical protein D1872_37340 [compost metagenome]
MSYENLEKYREMNRVIGIANKKFPDYKTTVTNAFKQFVINRLKERMDTTYFHIYADMADSSRIFIDVQSEFKNPNLPESEMIGIIQINYYAKDAIEIGFVLTPVFRSPGTRAITPQPLSVITGDVYRLNKCGDVDNYCENTGHTVLQSIEDYIEIMVDTAERSVTFY